MASILFVDYQTVIPASWLNDVNNLTYNGTLPAPTLTVTNLVVNNSISGAGLSSLYSNPTFSGNVTLSAGTANGVAYLNGSKVLTTGSALTFDGTNLGVGGTTNYGAGTATATVDASAYSAFTLKVGGVRYGQLYATTSALTLDTWSGTGPIVFSINTGEQMRLTSTGLGIGTSTTTNGRLNVLAGTAATGTSAFFGNADGTYNPYLQIQHSSAGVKLFTGSSYGAASNNLIFGNSSTSETMRLDSSGNLGLGVTPSAWYSGIKALEINGKGNSIYGIGTEVDVTANAYYPGGAAFLYGQNGYATKYVQITGQHQWYTAPSGTAGNAISFTQAMMLDASGNLGIGTTSPAYPLDISDSTNGIRLGVSVAYYRIFRDPIGANAGLLQFYGNQSSYTGYIFGGIDGERMRIDSSGNLLVGTTTSVEGARLHSVLNSTTAAPIQAGNGYAGSSGLRTFYSSLGNGTNSVSNTNCYHLVATSQGSAVYYLYGNGTTSFTSDQRLKKNIETARNGYVNDLCKLRVVKYQWNTEPDNGTKELGLIAQEVEQVFPGLVQDAAEELQGFTPKVLKASVLPFMLLKAIQEQQEQINQLTARVAQLKGN